MKSKAMWGKNIQPYFGIQCSRQCQKNTKYCIMHSKNQRGGIFGEFSSKPIYDLTDELYAFLKENQGLLIHSEYITSNLSIGDYITLLKRQLDYRKRQKETCEKMQQVVSAIFDRGLDGSGNKETRQEQIQKITNMFNEMDIPQIDDDTPNEPKLPNIDTVVEVTSKEFDEMKAWWEHQEKIRIVDNETQSSSTFALVHKRLYTPNRVLVGEEQYWKNDKNIPEKLKNNDGYVLDPVTQNYIQIFHFFDKGTTFHTLPKQFYSGYKFLPYYQKLQKTHEIEYL